MYGADAYWVRLDGGAARSVGKTTAYTFDDLEAGTDYEFEVQAGFGSVRSAWSDPFEVTTVSPGGRAGDAERRDRDAGVGWLGAPRLGHGG